MSLVTSDLLVLALAGLAAGFAIAMPVGAIAVLILRESMMRGRSFGLAAGAGVATVDFVYCALAVGVGTTVADAVAPLMTPLAIASGVVIMGIGVYQLVVALRAGRNPQSDPETVPGSLVRVYGRFVALTAINPATIVYFLALSAVLATVADSTLGPIVFVAATFIASLTWQSALALVGAAVGSAVSERTTRIIGVVASCVIIALGIVAVVIALARL